MTLYPGTSVYPGTTLYPGVGAGPGSGAPGVITRGRVAAEALMIDSVVVTRVTATFTNAETGVITPTTTVVYAGKCKVQQGGVPSGQSKDLGQASIQVSRLQLHLPVSATGVAVDDVATITASPLDASLVGRRFTIRAVAHKTYLTARRCDVEEVAS